MDLFFASTADLFYLVNVKNLTNRQESKSFGHGNGTDLIIKVLALNPIVKVHHLQ